MPIKKILVNALVLSATLVLLFLALEILSRLVLDKPQSYSFLRPDGGVPGDSPADASSKYVMASGVPNVGLYIETESGIFLRPNTFVIVDNHYLSKKTITIKTNSLGFRYDELGPKKPDELRILVLGDSITFGDYVENEYTYPSQMEAHAKRRLPDRNIRAINAGVGSIGIRNELGILLSKGLMAQPDIVLVGLYLNDANESIRLQIASLPFPLDKSHFLKHLMHRLALIGRLTSQEYAGARIESVETERERFALNNPLSPADWKRSEYGFNKLIYNSFSDWGFAWSDAYWDVVGETLEIMKRICRENGIELVVVLFPVSYQVQAGMEVDLPQRRFREMMLKLDTAHIDLLPYMREKYRTDGEDMFFDHCHYRESGNVFIGRTIADYLITNNLLSP